ncbi:MAG: hypothetical protein IKI37_08550 [Oscillospiraceae bacterium]|nr:hypothetical protein [Oscillospiraceae bacterium]
MRWQDSTIVSIALILLLLLCSGTEMILTFVMILTVIIFLTADDLLKTHAPNIPEINRIMLSGFAGLIACMIAILLYNL